MRVFFSKVVRRKSSWWAFLVLFLLVTQPAYSSECYVKSGKVLKGKESNRSSDVLAGATLKPCAGLAVNAVLCYENKFEQPICSRRSGVFSLAALTNERSSESMRKSLYSIYNPVETEHYGGKGLKEFRGLSGFPGGDVLLPESSLRFSAKSSLQSKLERFELYKDGSNKLLFSSTKAGTAIVIPAGKLYAGGKFKWMAMISGKKYSGGFTVALREDQKEFIDELRAMLAKSDSSASTGHLLRAVLARDYGYTFDMQQSIAAARAAIKQEG